ncbi:deoxycytidyl transferase [Rhizophlyctis rosea]|nr:deoxycytidyl transferase [Rhizophlyctis rosea]
MAFPGGFREYMQVKRRKLEEQGNEVATALQQSNVLSGTVLYFDGYTGSSTLSMIQFKELVLTHGALVRDKLEGDVSHIIAVQMTDKKMKEWRKPVVRPEWLLESIDGQKLLPWTKYRLYSSVVPSQSTMANFIGSSRSQQSSPSLSPERTIPLTPAQTTNAVPDLAGSSDNISLPNESDSEDNIANAPNTDNLDLDTLNTDNPDADPEPDYPPFPFPDRPTDATTDHAWFGPKVHLDMSSDWVKQNISTAPGFIDKYFSSSRLHHLSTWKSALQSYVAQNAKPKPKITNPKLHVRTIFHIDMDCFFASVALRAHPKELAAQPVAIAHSSGTTGASTSEIASCNYSARAAGIKNGMSLGKARTLCPTLTVLPYTFAEYDACSKALYRVLLKYGDEVQAVSVDEAFVDVTSKVKVGGGEGQEVAIAEKIRREIFTVTEGCCASIGIGPNIMLSRVATRKAKPDGVFQIRREDAETYLKDLPVSDLPGVGWVLAQKLATHGLTTCGHIAQTPLPKLQETYGEKTGMMLHSYSRGIDTRTLQNPERKSIGAEVNWGVRFETQGEVEKFMGELCGEVWKRMGEGGVRGGKVVTVKIKRRRYEGEPAKVLGCGECDNLSKSVGVSAQGFTKEGLARTCVGLMRELKVLPDYVRGMGVHVSRLVFGWGGEVVPVSASQTTLAFKAKSGGRVEPPRTPELKGLEGGGVVVPESPLATDVGGAGVEVDERRTEAETGSRQSSSPKSAGDYAALRFEDVDESVLAALPEDIRKEILGSLAGGSGSGPAPPPPPPPPPAAAGPSRASSPPKSFHLSQFVPTASQVDPEVLRALPAKVRREVLGGLERRGDGSRTGGAGVGGRRGSGSGSGVGKSSPGKRKRGRGGKVAGGNGPIQALFGWDNGGGSHTSRTTMAPPKPSLPQIPQPPPLPKLTSSTHFPTTPSTPTQTLSLLKTWMSIYPSGPHRSDVETLKTFLVEMVEGMEMEVAEGCLGVLRGAVGVRCDGRGKGKGSAVWSEVVEEVCGVVEERVKSIYGVGLKCLRG